jgi:hypothetical protein
LDEKEGKNARKGNSLARIHVGKGGKPRANRE